MKISPLNVLGIIAQHRVAPNMLMLIMLIVGLWAINSLNVRFFPQFEIQLVSVSVPWNGAAAEDVEISLIQPLENELRNVSNLDKLTSISRDNLGLIYLEFPEDANIDEAADEVKQYVDQAVGQLPNDAEIPRVKKIVQYDDIMRIALSGDSLTELRRIARQMETELNDLGIAKVDVSGLPREEIQVHIDRSRLVELNASVREVGAAIAQQNRDVSAGDVAVGNANARLRALSKTEDLFGLSDVPVATRSGGVLRLSDVADINRVPADNQKTREFNERPSVEFQIRRRPSDNMLQSAERVNQWIEQKRAELPPSLILETHNERWKSVQSRLDLLLKNGAQGLVLVILVLFIFLSGRVAFWVAVGIPAVFLGTLFIMKLTGGTINMISMFALIMATGIIVDDAIVVGENAVYEHEKGRNPLDAAVGGAWAMVAPVVASTFTTISSFLPLFVISGIIGSIIYDIPFVIVCILLAALFECFFILPGHLYSAFKTMKKEKTTRIRKTLEDGFYYFQEEIFRPIAKLSVKYRGATIAACFGILIFSISLFAGGLVKYRFFPSSELNIVNANVAFTSGTPQEKVRDYVRQLANAAKIAESELGENGIDLVRFISIEYGAGGTREQPLSGDEYAKVRVELASAETRKVRARDFVRAWKDAAPQSPGLENLNIQEQRGGPPGADLEVLLTGSDIQSLKAAALEVQDIFNAIPGVSQPTDDTPFGKSQIAFELNALGRALGLSTGDVAAQLRDAVDGYKAQTFYEGVDEIEVRVFQTGAQAADNLASFQVRTPNGSFVSLEEVATLRPRRGFDTIRRIGGRTAINVVGEVDFAAIGDLQAVIANLRDNELREIAGRYGINYSFEGQQADQRQTIADMQIGLVMALLFIYIILTWVFSSWTVPLVIMLTMPLGVIGAVLGHWIMGIEMSILSFFGVFALMGIIVNDSIVLVRYFQQRQRREILPANASRMMQVVCADRLIVEAACRRLRAVLVTSLTTIGGLLPLMFEKSTQAQFLIPMAVSICFGLMFATVLILLFTPACMSYHQSIMVAINSWRGKPIENIGYMPADTQPSSLPESIPDSR